MSISLHHQNTINKMNIDELLELNSFVVKRIKEERARQSRLVKLSLHEGAKVSFEDNNGHSRSGEVTKVMRKFARVRSGSDVWRVPMSMLTVK